jgi:hypothetical protein
MQIKTGSKEDAVHALINLWLKDTRKSCAYCGRSRFFEDCGICEGKNPPLGTNAEILEGFYEELKEVRATRKNKFASNNSKDFRLGISMPIGLYQFLDKTFKEKYKVNLFDEKGDLNWFMKKFGKYFAIPEEV